MRPAVTKADFFTCVAWRQQADFVSKYLKKGAAIILEGSMRNADFTDSNGVKHYAMELLTEHIEFGGPKNSSSNVNAASDTPSNTNFETPVQIGDLSDFEEILSDGDAPF